MSMRGAAAVVTLGLVVAGGYAAYDAGYLSFIAAPDGGSSTQSGPRRGGPTPVVVAPVVKENFSDRLEAIGTLAANEAIVVTASVTGKVTEINFDDGDRVEQGALLVAIDDDEEQAQLQVQVAELEEQRKQLDRIEGLARTSAASQSRLDEQIANVRRAEANVEAARARLRDYRLTAPFSGLLGIRELSVGALVSPGTEITTLDDISVLKLDFSVPETFLSSLSPGQSIEAETPAFQDEKFAGIVQSIGSRVDPETRSVAVRAQMPNDDLKLRPGMLMLVDLIKDPRVSLLIPEQALVPRDNRQYILRVGEDMTVEEVLVEIGSRLPGAVEVLDGLAEGDLVVIEGTTKARPGGQVRILSGAPGDAPVQGNPRG